MRAISRCPSSTAIQKIPLPLRSRSRDCSTTPPAPASTSSWNVAVRVSAQAGRFKDTVSFYARMHHSGVSPSNFAIAAALKACARVGVGRLGCSVHGQILKLGQGSDVYVGTALVDFYARLHGVAAARKAFDEMPTRNVVSWNSVLSSHLKGGDMEGARSIFDEMPVRDVVSWNSMVAAYAKAGKMDRALRLFEEMPEKNPASWNGMISGYVERGDMDSARKLFDEMPEKSNVSWISMISGYARLGDCRSARCLFDQMVERDLYSWNAMIACYVQNSRSKDALELFNRMLKLGIDGFVKPDEVTFSSVISACSQLGDMRFGSWVEIYMNTTGIELDDHLKTALVDFYAKCGSMERASDLFAGLRRRDLVAYSAMILGCGMNGNVSNAIKLFGEMLHDGIVPNAITFMGLLTAYSHAGLVEDGLRCLHSMQGDHGVVPSAVHYAIMVDLLGRVGHLDEAYEVIRSMPVKPCAGAWGALLLACRLHGNVELGEVAAKNCFELEPEASGYYVLLANIYAEAGMWDEAKMLRNAITEKGLNLTSGCSWAEPAQKRL